MNTSFQLDSVIQVLLSSDNQRRIQAQAYIDELPKTNFEQGIDAFLLTMNHQNPQVAMMAALLLKKKYLDAKENFLLINKSKLELIVHSVQNMLIPDKPYNFLKRCCEILVKIFTYADQKKELISIVQGMAASEATNMKLALMYLIEIICQFAFDDQLLMEYSAAMDAIFQRGFADQNNEIKVATFKTLTIFLSSITDQKLVNKFASVLQTILTKSIELIKFDQESGIIAIQSLNQLIQAHPKFIKPILNDALMIFTEIMETPKLLTNLRISAMHGIFVLALNHAPTIRKSKYFKTKMVESYMKMLAQTNNISLQEWSNELNNQIISKNNISMSTQEHLYNILPELGNKFLLPLFIPYIQQCLASSDTSYQHAGLTALAILTEDCHETFKSELKNLLSLIMPLLSSTNPLIIHDILIAMGYMSEEFAPQIQINFGQLILGFICSSLVHPYPKVQYGAILCIQNFEKGLQGEEAVHVIDPFLNQILTEIGKIFESSMATSNYMMLQGILDTIGTIASISSFATYYSMFMPGLKKIIQMINPDTPQKSSLRNKSIQTIGYLLSSVKTTPDLFNPDCAQMMIELTTLQQTLPIEDATHRPIYTVYENVVECLGEGFLTYSDFVMSKAIPSALRKVEFHVVDQTETDKHEKNSANKMIKMKLDLKIDGVKNLMLNTDTFQQKIEASNLLASMAEYMKGSFFKYADAMVPVILQLISYKSSKEIRINMLEIIKHMVTNAPQAQRIPFLSTVWGAMTIQLATLIKTKDNASVQAMVGVMASLFPFMSAQMRLKLPEMMQAVLSLVKSLTAEIQKIYAEREMDEDASEEMGDEIGEVEQVLVHVQKIMEEGKFDNLKPMFPKDYEFGNLEASD